VPQDPSDRDTRDDRVIFLLNRLGEQLIRSEKERLTMGVKLARIEQQQKETAAALAKAEVITKQIGDLMAQQGRFNKRIEQLTHDKLRINSKLERIEDAVVQTRDALEAKALVLLTGQSVAADSSQPQIPADPAKSVPVPMPENDNKTGGFRGKLLSSHAASVAFIIGVTVFGGWAAVKLATTDYTDAAVVADANEAADEQQAEAIPPQPAPAQSVPDNVSPPPLPRVANADDGRPHPVMIHVAQDENRGKVSSAPDDLAALAAQMNDIAPAAGEPAAKPEQDAETQAGVTPETFVNPDALGSELNRVRPAAGRMAPDKPADIGKIAAPAAKAEPASLPVPAPTPKKPAEADKAETAPALAKDDPAVAKFLSRQRDAKALAERVQPDTSLPAVVQEIEKKALEGVPEAQHDLAALYVTGNAGVTQDYNKAAFWFREAAIGGVANARYNLGVLYQQGTGVPKDISKAIEWYRAAAALGHPEAEYNLGIAHIEGIGAKYNPQAAAHYFRESADGGVIEAAYNLGLIYENALLGRTDQKEALYWYKRAADRGNKQAEGAMQQLAKNMDLDEAGIEKAVGNLHPEETQAAAQAEAKKLAAQTAAAAPASTPTPASVPPVAETVKAPTSSDMMSDGADAATAVSLAEPSIASTIASATSITSSDNAVLAQIQEQLIRRGLLPGPADGTGNQQTSDAIRAYQNANGLNADGRATQALLAHMLSSDIKTPAQKATPTAHADATGTLSPGDLQTPGVAEPAKD
jgi:TPR repeat protein